MENIEDFNLGTGLIFGYLYQHFPTPCMLNVRGIVPTDTVTDEPRHARRLRVLYRVGPVPRRRRVHPVLII